MVALRPRDEPRVFLTAVSKIPSVRNRYRFPSCRARVFDARREGCRSSPPPPHESAAYLAVTATQLPDERLLSACPILHVFYARHMSAVRTAIDGVGRLNAMAEDGAPAVSASGRQGVNGALETVEDVMDRIWRLDRKSPVVVVSACFANGHCSTSVRVDRERAAVGPGQRAVTPDYRRDRLLVWAAARAAPGAVLRSSSQGVAGRAAFACACPRPAAPSWDPCRALGVSWRETSYLRKRRGGRLVASGSFRTAAPPFAASGSNATKEALEQALSRTRESRAIAFIRRFVTAGPRD
jgi:hypothetical protein